MQSIGFTVWGPLSLSCRLGQAAAGLVAKWNLFATSGRAFEVRSSMPNGAAPQVSGLSPSNLKIGG